MVLVLTKTRNYSGNLNKTMSAFIYDFRWESCKYLARQENLMIMTVDMENRLRIIGENLSIAIKTKNDVI